MHVICRCRMELLDFECSQFYIGADTCFCVFGIQLYNILFFYEFSKHAPRLLKILQCFQQPGWTQRCPGWRLQGTTMKPEATQNMNFRTLGGGGT